MCQRSRAAASILEIIDTPTGSSPISQVYFAAASGTHNFSIVPVALIASTFDRISQRLSINWNRYVASSTVLPTINRQWFWCIIAQFFPSKLFTNLAASALSNTIPPNFGRLNATCRINKNVERAYPVVCQMLTRHGHKFHAHGMHRECRGEPCGLQNEFERPPY